MADAIARWDAAVHWGAQGRVARARPLLGELADDARLDPAIRSLAASTRASLTRQAGGHAVARIGDGRAALLAAGGDPRDPWAAAAWLDGLIGLAADNLGIGDFAASRRLLDRAADYAAALPGPQGADEPDWRSTPRTALRLSWVTTEWGLYSGDLGVARAGAAASVPLAAALPSPRHRLKTGLIAAAVDAASGDTEGAARGARDAYRQAGDLGLLPLRWAAATLLAGVAGDGDDDGVDYPAEVAALRRRLALRGMPLAPLGPTERHGR